MPSNKWFMTAIEQTLTATGYIIVITTDIACHLWMRWTTVEPKEHLIQRTKRGLAFLVDKYFCFDVYEDNEQEEAGDTLIHTFIKEPWPVCETRYFYFQGEIAGVASKSTTAIFSKHRTAPPFGPPTWIECPIYQRPIGGPARDPDWSIVQTKDPWYWGFMTGEQIGTIWSEAQHLVRRRGIIWDTTAIPVGSQIVDAYMRRYGYYVIWPGDNVDFFCCWVDAALWLGTSNPDDYAIWNGFTDKVAELEVLTTWTSRRWKDIPLTPLGLEKVVPGGLTKMVGVTDVDLTNTNPGTDNRDFYWYGVNVDFPQILHVQYRPPL